jgi:hypothetical protein
MIALLKIALLKWNKATPKLNNVKWWKAIMTGLVIREGVTVKKEVTLVST